jgi:hypothetical protein
LCPAFRSKKFGHQKEVAFFRITKIKKKNEKKPVCVWQRRRRAKKVTSRPVKRFLNETETRRETGTAFVFFFLLFGPPKVPRRRRLGLWDRPLTSSPKFSNLFSC